MSLHQCSVGSELYSETLLCCSSIIFKRLQLKWLRFSKVFHMIPATDYQDFYSMKRRKSWEPSWIISMAFENSDGKSQVFLITQVLVCLRAVRWVSLAEGVEEEGSGHGHIEAMQVRVEVPAWLDSERCLAHLLQLRWDSLPLITWGSS